MSSPAPSQRLGPYELIEQIGKGGMGEVWRARDPRLGRDVAIKISGQQFSDRFEREARTVASLNHPSICHLYDVGPNYLVMELIAGETLKGPLPLDEALNIARQIADALDTAHEKGIVHRDLKPANIKIKPDGSVKVLDFGLARATVDEGSVTPDSPTLLSMSGMILGTAGYMSPEQAKGKPVDKRADIFAFGVVLYEMVTGEQPFHGETIPESLASIIKEEPNWTIVPARLQRLLRKCLEKDPRKRLRDIGDWEGYVGSEVPIAAPSQSRSVIIGWAIASVATLALAALSVIHFRETPIQTQVIRLEMSPPKNAAFSAFQGSSVVPAISPDGRRIAFAARTGDGKDRLWIRLLDSTTAQPLAGTDGAYLPFWSPDGRSIGFFGGSKLNTIDSAGGPVLAIADAIAARGASWNAQGTVLFAPRSSGPLQRVPAGGGAVSDATRLEFGESTHRWPWLLPDGRHFLFAAGLNGMSTKAIRLGSLDTLDSRKLLDADSNAIYSSGYLLFLRGETLMAAPFDAKTLRLAGEALPVVDKVESSPGTTLGSFTASANGLLAYMSGAYAESDLAWFDRKGNRTGSLGEAAPYFRVRFSPDERSLAASIVTGKNIDIWLYDVARGLRTRFTFDPAAEFDAVWSPDAKTIIYDSSRRHADLFRKAADGSGPEEQLYSDQFEKNPVSISPDGRFLLYRAQGDPKTGSDLWILPQPLGPPGAVKPYPFLHTQFNEVTGQFSPDGHWVVYQSDESGRSEIYVVPFPGPGGKRQISSSSGQYPRWRADGNEIFYVAPDQRLMATEVTTKGGGLEIGAVHPLFGPLLVGNLYQYDVSADGQRILAITPRQNASESLTVVQNWPAGLRK